MKTKIKRAHDATSQATSLADGHLSCTRGAGKAASAENLPMNAGDRRQELAR